MIERIISIIVPVFGVIGVGYAYARWRGERVRPEAAALNGITLNVLAPLLCFTAFASREFELTQHASLMAAGAIVVVGSGVLAWPIAKLAGIDARTFVPPMMFNNCGNMGLPLAALAFGTGALGPAVALFMVSNVLHFSAGVRIVSHGRLPWRQSLRLLASPIMIGSAVGLGFAAVRLHLPQALFDGLKLLGDACIPLMLFSLGVRMIDISFRSWGVGVLGAVACPATGLAAAYAAAALVSLNEQQWGQLLLFAALPPAVLNFLIAELYQQEPERVASIVLLGNIAAVIFVPIGLTLGLR
ncbi:MAG TPA: AEC family transporter [Burkholderiaceae bacterium]|nr:AEC family transporter [Burkholderiaceae bacterium]